MNKILRELGFIENSNAEFEGFYKAYKWFRLYVARSVGSKNWVSSITIKWLEISIPLTVDELWLVEFDHQNTQQP